MEIGVNFTLLERESPAMYLQGNDLCFRTFGSLIPCHCTVASVAADFEDCQQDKANGVSEK